MGFFVLLGFVVYFVLAKFAVNAIEKYSGSKIAKYVGIAVFVLIPTWDIVPGQLYFQHLCKEEAGIKVFKTVEVERMYFLENGQPDGKKLSARYSQPNKYDRDFSSIFSVRKIESSIKDQRTAEILGTATDFSYYGGWINANLFPQGPPDTCPQSPNHSVHTLIWREVIKPKTDSPVGGK